MSFTLLTNLVTIILCLAVLVQSVRMMRSLAAVKAGPLPQMVQALDASTARASQVLVELKGLLQGDAAANARKLGEAEAMRDELGIMIGIANATADRLLEAVEARRHEDVPSEKDGNDNDLAEIAA